MSSLLINDRPIMFLPKLAVVLGSIERAIVLQQIHWLLHQPRNGVTENDERWVFGSYAEWCELYFPMWSPHTLRKHIVRLEQDGVLISAQLRANRHDQTKYYRIDYTHESLNSMRPDVVASERPDVVASIYRTKTSTETSTESVLDDDFRRVVRQYESDIGIITPTLGESLQDAIDEYGSTPVIDAIKAAVKQNVRRWSYIEAILRKWKTTGRASDSRQAGAWEQLNGDIPDYMKG